MKYSAHFLLLGSYTYSVLQLSQHFKLDLGLVGVVFGHKIKTLNYCGKFKSMLNSLRQNLDN